MVYIRDDCRKPNSSVKPGAHGRFLSLVASCISPVLCACVCGGTCNHQATNMSGYKPRLFRSL